MIRPGLALATLWLSGCPSGGEGPPLPQDCSDELLFEATACDEVYCGEATVEVGSGSGGFQAIAEGGELIIWYGPQGGYHVDITAEMQNFCPIVFLRPSLWLDRGDGTKLEMIFEQTRHVQAVRVEPTVSPRQQFWGIRGFVPCEHWPEDPEHEVECGAGAGSEGHLEQFEIELRIEAEDHNGRIATDSRRVQPTCCNNEEGR